MRRVRWLVGAGLLLGCPAADDAAPESGSSMGDSADGSSTSSATVPVDGSGSDTTPAMAWLEVGWGTTEFNAFDGELPVVVGPQGLYMFSMPMRGQGFHNPPDPSFDNPDMPILQAWVDVPGFAITEDGHFNEVEDYPALFYPSLDDPGTLEAPAVWLVLPDGVEPEELSGASATLHAEMIDRDGLVLVDDHELIIGEIPPPPDGP